MLLLLLMMMDDDEGCWMMVMVMLCRGIGSGFADQTASSTQYGILCTPFRRLADRTKLPASGGQGQSLPDFLRSELGAPGAMNGSAFGGAFRLSLHCYL